MIEGRCEPRGIHCSFSKNRGNRHPFLSPERSLYIHAEDALIPEEYIYYPEFVMKALNIVRLTPSHCLGLGTTNIAGYLTSESSFVMGSIYEHSELLIFILG